MIYGRKLIESESFLIGKVSGFGTRKYIDRYWGGEYLTIKTKENKFIKLDSQVQKNYPLIKDFCQENLANIGDQVFVKHDRRVLFYLMFLILITVPISYFAYQAEVKIVDYEHLKEIEVTLESSPKLHQKRNRNSTRSYRFDLLLQEFPSFNFRISNQGYSIADKKISRIPAKKSIKLLIRKDEYESKLMKLTPPNFLMKHFQWDKIEIYDLKYGDDHLLDYDRYKEIKEEKKGIFLALIFGLNGLLISCFFAFRKVLMREC